MGKEVMIMAGRPTDYSPELADAICERLGQGESMRSVSRDDAMPSMATLFKWLRVHPQFLEQYTRAKEESADAMAEDILEIADNEVEQPLIVDGLPMQVDGQLVMVKDNVSVQHAKLRVDTRKWLMAKMKPKRYGEKVTNEHTGANGGPIETKTEWVVQPVKPVNEA